jgi:hypothetical protein
MNRFDEFCEIFPFSKTTQLEQAIGFSWFYMRNNESDQISFAKIIESFHLANLPKPNVTRLKGYLSKCRDAHRGTKVDMYRLHRDRMTVLDNEYGFIFKTSSIDNFLNSVNIHKAPLLSDTDIEDVKCMAELYIILSCYENSVRKLIEDVLQRYFGDKWWDAQAGASLKQKYNDRKDKEQKNKWVQPRGTSPLLYIDWGDLVKLIRKNEALFLPYIGELTFVENRFEELEKIRNIVAHNGYLKAEDDFSRVVLSFNDWCRQLS